MSHDEQAEESNNTEPSFQLGLSVDTDNLAAVIVLIVEEPHLLEPITLAIGGPKSAKLLSDALTNLAVTATGLQAELDVAGPSDENGALKVLHEFGLRVNAGMN